MPEFTSNQNSFYYEVHGTGDPLVLIAGFSCDLTLWEDLVKAFSHTYQVLIFDNRGVGRSSVPQEPYTIEDMAEDTYALIQHLGFKRINLLGHSMGGAIAQTLAYRYPETIKKLILCNTSAKFRGCAQLAEQFVYKLKTHNFPLELQAEYILPWIYSDQFLENPEVAKEFICSVLQDPFPQSLEGFKGQLKALSSFDSRKWLIQVNLPTLIVAGGEDRLCLKDYEELQLCLPQSQTLLFPNAGHIPFIEESEQFVKGVMDFLKARQAEVIPEVSM